MGCERQKLKFQQFEYKRNIITNKQQQTKKRHHSNLGPSNSIRLFPTSRHLSAGLVLSIYQLSECLLSDKQGEGFGLQIGCSVSTAFYLLVQDSVTISV